METAVKQSKRFNKALIVVALLAVIIAAAIAYVLLRNPYSYKYANLDSYALVDSKNHAGMTVDKPVEFAEQMSSEPSNSFILQKPVRARLIHQKTIKGKPVVIGEIALDSLSTVNALNQTNIDIISRMMTDTKASGHTAVLAPMQAYVSGVLNPDYSKTDYQLTYSETKALANLKHAWSLDFAATAQNPADKKDFPDRQGTVIEVLTGKGQYFAMVETVSTNWQKNQTVWQKVINSLKVDQ